MILDLIRDELQPVLGATFGKMFADGKILGQVLEDQDRWLEKFSEAKVYGKTAIPRGQYRVQLSYSNRFKRIMPEVLDVPGFKGVRIHAGNTTEDTEGCPLLGAVRTDSGVAQCAGVNQRLFNLIESAEQRGEDVWLNVL